MKTTLPNFLLQFQNSHNPNKGIAMKIVQLQAENVKRLKAVTIKPDGSVVTISGRNAQGKSSVLDSIALALGGKEWQGAKPIREGADKGKIVVTLDDGITITRTLTPSGGTLTVSNAEGMKFSTPQAILDKLYGKLSFDPIAFARMDQKKQAETLKSLVGIDFTEIDQKRAGIFAHRTEVNRKAKSLQAQVEAAPRHDGAPAEEISVSQLMSELSAAQKENQRRDLLRRNVGEGNQKIANDMQEIAGLEERIKALQSRIAATKAEMDKIDPSEFVLIDTKPISDQISNADAINRKVRENAAHKKLAAEAKAATEESEMLTSDLNKLDEQKRTTLESAKFPINGLSFDESGVLYKGIPFSQCSSAEQLRVSVAMGLAMNPKLRVLLIRDGSLLDEDNLKMISEMATAADSQVWIERVSNGGEVGIVIEDGEVVQHEEPTQPLFDAVAN